MEGIKVDIRLQENLTIGLLKAISVVNTAMSAMEQMHSVVDEPADTTGLREIRGELVETSRAARDLNMILAAIASRSLETEISVTVPMETSLPALPMKQPEPVEVPVVWQQNDVEVFTGSGMERFRQETQSADAMLKRLCNTQDAIAKQAYNAMIFPPEAFRDLNSMAVRVDDIRDRIQQIENNPMNMGTRSANTELEQLRGRLAQMLQGQENLNRAVDNMDVSAAGEAYRELSQTIGSTEQHLRDIADEQGRLNQVIDQGKNQASGFLQTIRGAIAPFFTTENLIKGMNLSDQFVTATARLDRMNDGMQTTQELQEMIFLCAERSRGSYQATADAVSNLGSMAGDAFGSSAEIVAFTEQVGRQFRIAGMETSDIDAAMLQLTETMGAGVLQGEAYNRLLQQAPNIIQAIADYMGVPVEQLGNMAAEGQITAGVLKSAMFAAADETNAKFENMPKTFEQIGASIENYALMAFRPVLQSMNELGNSEFFQGIVSGVIGGLYVMAGGATDIFNLLAGGAQLIADNWSWLGPIIYGVVGALAAFCFALGIYNLIQTISNGIKMAAAFASSVHKAALALEKEETFKTTAAQYGFNSALLACPITWIVIGIIALITAILILANHFSGAGHIAQSAFGAICGGINVVIAFFKNLLMTGQNVFNGLLNAVVAVAANIKIAFENSIFAVKAGWYSLLSTVLGVVQKICEGLNRLPFVEIDYSGVASMAYEYAVKAEEARGNIQEFISISDAFDKGMSTNDVFQDGWVMDAYRAGASWGDGVADKVSDFFPDMSDYDIPSPEDYTASEDYMPPEDYTIPENYGPGGVPEGIGSGVDEIAGNTGAMAESMDVAGEELKYLRDLAEQEAVNRFTTAEINIEQTNYNTVKNGMDLDGVVSGLTDAVNEAVEITTEGVHE